MVMDGEGRERETTPSAHDDRSNLVDDLVGAVEMAAQFGDYRRTQRKECNNLVRRMKLLLPLFEELRDLDSPISDNHFSRFCKLKKALAIAKKLLRSCNEGSKIYLALESEAMMPKFHAVYDKISKALDDLPYDEIGISDEVKEQVELTSKQLKRAKKRTDTQDMELAMDLMVVFSKNDEQSADRAAMERLGKKMGLLSEEDLKMESMAVRSLMKQRGTQLGETGQQIVELLNKLKEAAGVESTEEEEDPVSGNRTLLKSRSLMIPHEFLCPITLEIMRDPVIVASGQSYERESIQRWLDTKQRTCPKTRQALGHLGLAPNYALKNLIHQWCERNKFEMTKVDENKDKKEKRSRSPEEIVGLVEQLSSRRLEWQRRAVKEVRAVSREEPEKRSLIAGSGGIPPLVKLLSYPDSKIQEHAVTALLNLSIEDSNKRSIAREGAIPAIAEVLRSGSLEARENSAAALFSLSILDENKAAVGGVAIPALVDLLCHGSLRGKRDAATALFNLCLQPPNRELALSAGLVPPLLLLAKDVAAAMPDQALSLLLLMAPHPLARPQILGEDHNFMEDLLGFLAQGTPKNKECAAALLLELASADSSLLVDPALAQHLQPIAATGTSRARRKAAALLQLIHRHQT